MVGGRAARSASTLVVERRLATFVLPWRTARALAAVVAVKVWRRRPATDSIALMGAVVPTVAARLTTGGSVVATIAVGVRVRACGARVWCVGLGRGWSRGGFSVACLGEGHGTVGGRCLIVGQRVKYEIVRGISKADADAWDQLPRFVVDRILVEGSTIGGFEVLDEADSLTNVECRYGMLAGDGRMSDEDVAACGVTAEDEDVDIRLEIDDVNRRWRGAAVDVELLHLDEAVLTDGLRAPRRRLDQLRIRNGDDDAGQPQVSRHIRHGDGLFLFSALAKCRMVETEGRPRPRWRTARRVDGEVVIVVRRYKTSLGGSFLFQEFWHSVPTLWHNE